MKSVRFRSFWAALLCLALLCTGCGLPICSAASQAEDVIIFTQMDDKTGLYLRLDEAVRGVSDALSAAFIPKNDVQVVPQIDNAAIRCLLPCAENGDRLELFLPVGEVWNGLVLHLAGLLDASGAETTRDIPFTRDSFAIDRVWFDYPDPDQTEAIRGYTGSTDTIYCIQGETITYGMDSDALLRRTEALCSGDAVRALGDGTLTAVAPGEGTITLRIAQKMTYTLHVRVFASAQARKRFLVQAAAADAGTILGRYFHETVSQAMVLGPFAVLAVPIVYPLAVFVAPIGFLAELIRLLLTA